jgi:hypothetical protein
MVIRKKTNVHYSMSHAQILMKTIKNLSQYANTLNELYERNRSIFETGANWKTTWEEYIDFKKKYSDPNRFKLKDYRSLHE